MDGFVALCAVLGKLERISLANCGLGPASAAELAKVVSSAGAAITSANLLHNPLGEGVHEIIEVFEQKEQLRTLCGFEEGIKEIDWKDSKKGPTEILLLAADLRACRAIAALTSGRCIHTARRFTSAAPRFFELRSIAVSPTVSV